MIQDDVTLLHLVNPEHSYVVLEVWKERYLVDVEEAIRCNRPPWAISELLGVDYYVEWLEGDKTTRRSILSKLESVGTLRKTRVKQ